MEPVRRCSAVAQLPLRFRPKLGLQSSTVEQGQAELIQEPARILDRLKARWVSLDGQAPSLRDGQVGLQKAGLVHTHGVPGSLQADRTHFQFRDDNLAEAASPPLSSGDRAFPLKEVISEILPETGLGRRPHVKQREWAVEMGKSVVREFPEQNRRGPRFKHPEPN